MEGQGLKDVAEQALIGLIQSVVDAANFLKGEIPLAVKELLTYYTVYYCVWVVLGVMLMSAFVPAFKASLQCARYNNTNTTSRDDDLFYFPRILKQVFGYFATVVGLVILVSTIGDLLKITLAPRIWLIEYASALMK